MRTPYIILACLSLAVVALTAADSAQTGLSQRNGHKVGRKLLQKRFVSPSQAVANA